MFTRRAASSSRAVKQVVRQEVAVARYVSAERHSARELIATYALLERSRRPRHLRILQLMTPSPPQAQARPGPALRSESYTPPRLPR